MEDFAQEAGTNDCLARCRCIELFEPAPKPDSGEEVWQSSPGKFLGSCQHRKIIPDASEVLRKDVKRAWRAQIPNPGVIGPPTIENALDFAKYANSGPLLILPVSGEDQASIYAGTLEKLAQHLSIQKEVWGGSESYSLVVQTNPDHESFIKNFCLDAEGLNKSQITLVHSDYVEIISKDGSTKQADLVFVEKSESNYSELGNVRYRFKLKE